jgi:hypothetical protein
MTLNEQFRQIAPWRLLLVALGMFWTFGYNGIWHRLGIDLEGKVTARQDFPQNEHTHGPTTLYTLQGSDGSIHEYTASRVDPSLPRTIPVGAYLIKRKGELSYRLNGARVDDFPLVAYVGFLIGGTACFIGASIWLASRLPRTRYDPSQTGRLDSERNS